jgi:hypothetical protein
MLGYEYVVHVNTGVYDIGYFCWEGNSQHFRGARSHRVGGKLAHDSPEGQGGVRESMCLTLLRQLVVTTQSSIISNNPNFASML